MRWKHFTSFYTPLVTNELKPKKQVFVRHLPTDVSQIMFYFLHAHPGNKLQGSQSRKKNRIKLIH